MLAPLYEEHQDAVAPGLLAREALQRIRDKMASEQKGEAFTGEMPDAPKFLLRTKGDAAKIRKWNAEHPLDAQEVKSWNVGPRWDQKADPEFEKKLLAEADAEKKRLAPTDPTKGLSKEEKKAALMERRAAAKAKADAARAALSAKPAGESYWDANASVWRPIGYMSRAKYARLVAEMPTNEHRAAFIEMFGHTQTEGARCPPPKVLKARLKAAQEAVRAAPAPKKGKDAKAAKPKRAASAAPAKRRGPNPEHLAKVTAMLTRPEGATLAEIGAAMGWQEHSASAFLSGIRKTRTIAKTVEARGNVYRLEKVS